MANGKFVISLDFELMWGVRDKKNKDNYGKNILGVHTIIPGLLKTFENHQVKATFSTVGFLFLENKDQFNQHIPDVLPDYTDKNLSPYLGHINQVEDVATIDPYHFAPQLIKLIQQCPDHEISTHTYSHYYCLEPGQTPAAFKADLQEAITVAGKFGIKLESLIFPRNQFNKQYLEVCAGLGISSYRGNEHSWIYKAKNAEEENLFRRMFRLADAYINISGHNVYSDDFMAAEFPVNIPSSRFLRPYIPSLKSFENIRLQRILKGMSYAAKNNKTYHLWWHPHNFGTEQEENFNFLEKILNHYDRLKKEFQFESITMTGLAKKLRDGK